MDVQPSFHVAKHLAKKDRYLTGLILLAMVGGIALGHYFPGISRAINRFQVGTTSIPIAIGLIIMMYPPLAKVRYRELPLVWRDWRLLGLSLIQNWILGPLLMFGLACLFLRQHPEAMVGVIMIGLARCIAMVLVWSELADGDGQLTAGLVALNSLFQILLYASMAYLFVTVLPPLVGLPSLPIHIRITEVVVPVLIYLGIPFVAGILSRLLFIKWRGQSWYEKIYLKRISPLATGALLFTVVIMFAEKGNQILQLPLLTLQIAMPLVCYFLIMFGASFIWTWKVKKNYAKAVSVAFTAASNNFELALAITVGVFGLNSPEAFAAIIGPLVEVPVMLVLVDLARAFARHHLREQ